MEKKLYAIRVGRKREDWLTNKVEYQGDTNHVNLRGTLEQMKEVIKILNIDCYQIEKFRNEDDFGFGEIVEQTQDITDFQNKAKEQREGYDRKMEEKVKRINQLPEIFEFKTYATTKLIFKRSEASFRQSYSSRISGGGITLQVTNDGRTHDIMLYPYVSKNGRLLKKSFKGSMEYTTNGNLIADDLESIIQKRDELKKLVDKV